jgi:steroid Delta-isomerase
MADTPGVHGYDIFMTHGKVIRHRDYWDAAEELYARLPVLKWLMRGLARQAAVPL